MMHPTRQTLFEIVGWLTLAGVLIVGVPLFICMPLWVDTTYHDMSARNILQGGLHYRDIFETNLPGMVWLHVAVRPIVGWSSEAIRGVDLGVVATIVLLLCSLLKRCGVSRAGRVWSGTAVMFFYLFETEFVHCQRDGWMLLPTVIALCLRVRQLARPESAMSSRIFWRAVLEGMVWGCAVWIKPHGAVPAIAVLLAGSRRLAGISLHKWLCDLLGILTGGMLVGAVGAIWLILDGTWPYLWDVLLNWNPEYYRWTPAEIELRLSFVLMYFAPWSLVHVAAIPLALYALVRARIWHYGATPEMPPARIDRSLLAALYLGWLFEASILQKHFHYAQAPVIFLAIAVVASHRWPVGPILIGWCVAGGLLHVPSIAERLPFLATFKSAKPYTFMQVVPSHKLINQDWYQVWWPCLTTGSTPAIKDHLSFYRGIHCAPNWTELAAVREYLKTLNLKDRELVCWDDTTHPLYLDLNIKPGIRFMHVNTSLEFKSKRPTILAELQASGHKYVVSDVAVLGFLYSYWPDEPNPGEPLTLPDDFPCQAKDVYPWNQPVVARFGRYWVHRIDNPVGPIRVPYPLWLDKP